MFSFATPLGLRGGLGAGLTEQPAPRGGGVGAAAAALAGAQGTSLWQGQPGGSFGSWSKVPQLGALSYPCFGWEGEIPH